MKKLILPGVVYDARFKGFLRVIGDKKFVYSDPDEPRPNFVHHGTLIIRDTGVTPHSQDGES